MFRRLFRLTLLLLAWPGVLAAGEALVLDVEGPIGPATVEYLDSGLETAAERGSAVVVLRMDTPGGLDTAMRDIIRRIIASPVPVATYVSPGGARAASAGTYILYASHVAAMAPGTNLGAATPVQIGGGSPPGLPSPDSGGEEGGDGEQETGETDSPPQGGSAMERKMINDAVAYIRSLAELRGRNADWAERAVREAASLPAAEAVEKNVADLVASDLQDLLGQMHGRQVELQSGPVTLDTEAATVHRQPPDWRHKLLAVITNPNVAYVLMLVGIYGLIFELANPGSIVPGVIGGIALLLALFAFQALPVNYAGLALILLGVAFMVGEAFMPSFGALGLGGMIAFVIGSVMLMDTEAPGFQLSLLLVAGLALASLLLLMGTANLALRAHRRPVVSGVSELVGAEARVLEATERGYRVHIHGESWQARSSHTLEPGQRVRVRAVDGLVLDVEPADES